MSCHHSVGMPHVLKAIGVWETRGRGTATKADVPLVTLPPEHEVPSSENRHEALRLPRRLLGRMPEHRRQEVLVLLSPMPRALSSSADSGWDRVRGTVNGGATRLAVQCEALLLPAPPSALSTSRQCRCQQGQVGEGVTVPCVALVPPSAVQGSCPLLALAALAVAQGKDTHEGTGMAAGGGVCAPPG